MMNFDGVADAHIGEAALVGGPGFIATVSHDYYNHFVSFTVRFGAKQGTPFYDSYRSVTRKDAWGDKSDLTYDYRVQRLSKIVTEAEYAPYLTDPEYLDNMKGRLVMRAGSGVQAVATGNGKQEKIDASYGYLTGGTLVLRGRPALREQESRTRKMPRPIRLTGSGTISRSLRSPIHCLPVDCQG